MLLRVATASIPPLLLFAGGAGLIAAQRGEGVAWSMIAFALLLAARRTAEAIDAALSRRDAVRPGKRAPGS
jgi:hypothetical protein